MAEHTTVFVTGPAGTGTRTYTEQGKALSIIATQLQANTQYQADAEYERPDGTVIQTTQSVQFRTLPAGTATISNELWVTSGTSSTIFKCDYTSTYAASSVQVDLEGTRYQGYLSGGTITVPNLPYYSPGTQKTFQIYLIDVYTEEIVTGRIMTLQTGSASISNLDCTLDSDRHAILTYDITSTYGVQGSTVIYNGQTYTATVSGGAVTVDLGTIPAGTTITFDVDVVDNYGNRYTIANQTVTIDSAPADVPIYFDLDEASSQAGVGIFKNGSPDSITVQTSFDGSTWSNYTLGSYVTLNSSHKRVYFRCSTNKFSKSEAHYYKFQTTTGNVNVGGNITSLINNNSTVQNYEFCYLFYNNTRIKKSNKLYLGDIATITQYVYAHMFQGCTSLTTTPSLPATSVSNWSYAYMFQGCTSLTTAPDLPATTLGPYCYYYMFRECTSLINAPSILPSTSTSLYCYDGMFYECTSLTTAPSLPATTAAQYCYEYMFYGCTSLVNAPALPATTLDSSCYYNMFRGCTSLTTAPSLPATTAPAHCYHGMFYECTSLTTAPSLPATVLGNYCYKQMFYGCTSLTTVPATLPATTLKYESYANMFRGCTSLVNAPEISATTLDSYCCQYMFAECINLTRVPSTLPAQSLVQNCYAYMFWKCTSIVRTPELPATTLASSCYAYMFSGCTSLISVSTLPATTLSTGCYLGMLYGCTSLVNAPALPATTLAISCYESMFCECTSLTTSPILRASTLSSKSYKQMFQRCTSLSSITCLAEDISASECTSSWVDHVAASGTFYKSPNMSSWQTGVSNIPSGWTVVDYQN